MKLSCKRKHYIQIYLSFSTYSVNFLFKIKTISIEIDIRTIKIYEIHLLNRLWPSISVYSINGLRANNKIFIFNILSSA